MRSYDVTSMNRIAAWVVKRGFQPRRCHMGSIAGRCLTLGEADSAAKSASQAFITNAAAVVIHPRTGTLAA